MAASVLYVGADDIAYQSLAASIDSQCVEITVAKTQRDAEVELARQRFDTVVIAVRMPPAELCVLMRRLRAADPERGLVAVVDQFDSQHADCGADDIVPASADPERLKHSLDRVAERVRLRQRRAGRLQGVTLRAGDIEIVGKSPAFWRAIDLACHAARGCEPLLIVGEPGTGKRLLARLVHEQSAANGKPCVFASCAAHGPTLEARLFGQEPGAFAREERQVGLLEQCGSGTLVLRDLESLPQDAQDKLARLLETGSFTRQAGSEQLRCDAHIVALASPEIDAAVQAKRFRRDLYVRFGALRVDVPPLRARREDVPRLANYFLRRDHALSTPPVTAIDADAMRALVSFDWPENVAELERCIRLSVARASGGVITRSALPTAVSSAVAPARSNGSVLIDVERPLADVSKSLITQLERTYLTEIARRYRGRIPAIARHSGLSTRAAAKRLETLGISKDRFDERYLFSDMTS